MGEIDVSPEHLVPVPNLPRSMEGLTVVQISDLHVGPYIRQKELEHVVALVNQLHPDVVAITGDVLDRHLVSLPDAVKGLSGLRSNFGTFAVLGNHDYYADRFSSSGAYRGGVKIAQGLASIKIPTLRNQVVHITEGTDRLAILGLDWLTTGPNDRNFFSYKPVETRRQLKRMLQEAAPEAPKVLLAHHPDTFEDVPAEVGLTLSGHTHGGGQVILGSIDGKPIGIGSLRFKYLSGLYQKNGSSLYVNRGIGYLGIPIRINCPPEISRFRLVRATENDV
jgi:predicted MPP superfamily phosphohydrolase